MGRAADVKSVSAVRAFKADLLEFQTALRQTLEVLLADVHRGVEWLESDRTAYWPAQVRRASDAISEARINLERCMLAAQSDERRSCYDEKKAFERAQQRLAYAEEKVRSTKHWLRVVRHETDEFQSRLAKLQHMVEHDLPRGIALLERLARALDKYVGYEPTTDRSRKPTGPDAEGMISAARDAEKRDVPPSQEPGRA